MTNIPTFFFSHARQDREEAPEKFLVKFFEDLEKYVAGLEGLVLPTGVLDSRVKQGYDWNTELSAGLAKSRVFVAILTPLYFKRPNCGKELAVFLLRNPALKIAADGALADAASVLPILWYAQKDTLVPKLIDNISNVPGLTPDEEKDPETIAAVDRYKRKGMARCVDSEPAYTELLTKFARTIRDMQSLPAPAQEVSFATAKDAFSYDWKAHFANLNKPAVASAPAAAVANAAPSEPTPLMSVVVYYITARNWVADTAQVTYADELIVEPLPGAATPMDAELLTLLSDFRAAGAVENITTYGAGLNPPVPTAPTTLLAGLKSLSLAGVPTIVVIDSAVWPGAQQATNNAIDTVLRSADWSGVALLVNLKGARPDVATVIATRNLPPRLFGLGASSAERVNDLRQVLVESRGRAMRAGSDQSAGSEALPLLKAAKPANG